jgi:hypothetical protein
MNGPKNPDAPASDKQKAYLRSLAVQRDVRPGMSGTEVLAALEEQISAGMTMGKASQMIERGKVAPVRQLAPGSSPAEPEPGYYVKPRSDGSGNNDFIVVVKNKAGTHVYGKKLMIEPGYPGKRKTAKWVYMPGAASALAGLDVLTIEEAAAFGHLHGFCFKCCKPLTDPESVKAGMGPVCRKALKR